MVGRHNADIADTLQLRDVAMATNFGTALQMDSEATIGFHVKDGLLSVICGDGNCCRRATVRLGIDTLIANILVFIIISDNMTEMVHNGILITSGM